MDIKKIVVCGAGTMGGGIAQVCANAGFEVWMYDLKEEYSQGGKNKIAAGLEKQVARGKITEEQKDALLARLHPTTDINCASEADMIIEAVLEIPEVKKSLYAQLEAVCPDTAIIGTNTSYIPISQLAADLKHPERFLGMHFFNPVYAMRLLEVIRGEKTSAPVLSVPQVIADPHIRDHRDMFPSYDQPKAGKVTVTNIPLKAPDMQAVPLAPAPEMGQHTHEVLQELLGLDEAAILHLEQKGVI